MDKVAIIFRTVTSIEDDVGHLQRNLLYSFDRKHEEILQKPFQKGRHSKVVHRSLHADELDRY